MSSEGTNIAAGWYRDPSMENTQRYWDGTQWTEHVQPLHPPAPQGFQGGGAPLDPTQQYPYNAAPMDPTLQQAYAPAPPPAGPQKSGMSTGLKVVIGLGVLLLATLGGCVALVALVASNTELPDGTVVVEDVAEEPLVGQPTDDVADGEQAGQTDQEESTTGFEADGGPALGTRDSPLPYDQPINITWNTFGDADGSVWTTTIGPPRDITAEVLADNQFNSPPPDGVLFVGFDVELVLQEAAKEPLSPGFNFSWELLGGATAAAYDPSTIETEFFGCGVLDGGFDDFAEVFAGGTLSGTVCIPLPAEDLGHAETQVALHFIDDSRAVFGS